MHIGRLFVPVLFLVLTILTEAYGHKYGAKEPVATNDPTVIEISKWAAKRLGGLLVEVDQAENQVVSGMMYYINFVMKKAGKDFCCKIEVWRRAWLHWIKLEKYHCELSKGYHNKQTKEHRCRSKDI